MGGRETVGPERNPLKIAFMAPPFNEDEEDSPSRIRAKKLVVIMKEALEPFISGHIARYKADYMPRAFGDAMQNWGVSTVLIESGMHDDGDPHFNVKMNFIALLKAFEAIATDAVEQADASAYQEIPLEGTNLFDILIRDALIFNGSGIPSFRGDIGININRQKKEEVIVTTGQIADIGDLSITIGRKIIEGKNLVVTPAFIAIHDDPATENSLLNSGFVRVVPVSELETVPEDLPRFSAEWAIDATEIPEYTNLAAQKLNIKRTGLIKRGYAADLIVFEDDDPGRIESRNIIYVIRNGVIIRNEDVK